MKLTIMLRLIRNLWYVRKVTGKEMKQKSIKTENNAHDQKGNLKRLGIPFNRSTCRLCTDVMQLDLPGVSRAINLTISQAQAIK